MTAPEIIHEYIDAGLRVRRIWPVRDGRCGCGDPGCRSAGKHPASRLVRNGLDDATGDHAVADGWAQRMPGSNWAVRPSPGLVVVDVDPRHGGATALAALTAEHGALPPTLTCRTGSGGLHAWFAWAGPVPGEIARGVDCKGPAGYLVAPPSVHESGGRYEWLNDLPPARPPSWLADLLNPPKRAFVAPLGRVGGGLDGLVRFVAAAQEGERNRSVHWAACRAAESQLDPEPIIAAAVAIGLSEREARLTVRSAYRRAA